MADDAANNEDMSLIPYAASEIVLRSGNRAVVRNKNSSRLDLRETTSVVDATEDHERCPTCQRPFGDAPPPPGTYDGYVDPTYFRLLQRMLPAPGRLSRSSRLRSSSRLAAQRRSSEQNAAGDPDTAVESDSDEPQPWRHRISKDAFSPNYFSRFFVKERLLGKGGRGEVLLVKHEMDGVFLGYFACKIVRVGDDHDWLSKVLAEVQTLQTLSHPNLVAYRHVWLENVKASEHAPETPCVHILQQYCNAGDLQSYLWPKANTTMATKELLKERMRRKSRGEAGEPFDFKPRQMKFEDIFSFVRDITSGLHHLHSHGFVHRDIKPQNCLLHGDGQKLHVLLSDFGEVQPANTLRQNTGTTGTISYCAPEVLRIRAQDGSYGNFTFKSDIYALGLVVYFMCFGKLPYSMADAINEENEDIEEVRREIMNWDGFKQDAPRLRSDLPDRLYKFLSSMLSPDPEKRPSTDEILQLIQVEQYIEEGHTHSGHGRRGSVESSSYQTPRNGSSSSTRARKASSIQTPILPPPSNGSIRGTSPSKSPVRQALPPPPLTAEDESEVHVASSLAVIRSRHRADESTPLLEETPPPRREVRALPAPAPAGPPAVLISLSTPLIKIGLFFLKYVSISRPCSPRTPATIVTYPLLLMACFDLIVPYDSSGAQKVTIPKHTILLMALHCLVCFIAFKMDALCDGPHEI